MHLTIESFKEFNNEIEKLSIQHNEILQKKLGEQFQKHFDLLVESIPKIKSIEWSSSQEDDSVYALTYFKVLKDNNYIYEDSPYSGNSTISTDEFNPQEIELILGFEAYLHHFSYLIVSTWGSVHFRLDSQ